MKVRCIKTRVKDISRMKIGGDASHYLDVGDEFLVYGVKFECNTSFVVIYHGEHLVVVPFELFEIIDDTISDTWRIRTYNYYDDRVLCMMPELFYRPYFLEDFAEREDKEREEFEEFRKLYEQ